MPVLRHRPPGLARLLLLALALCGFLAAPVLTLAGQTHAAVHADLAGHDHSGHAAHDDAEDAGSLLHASMHVSSCCGHVNALIPCWNPPAVPPARAAWGSPLWGEPPGTAPEDLFRPPIA